MLDKEILTNFSTELTPILDFNETFDSFGNLTNQTFLFNEVSFTFEDFVMYDTMLHIMIFFALMFIAFMFMYKV